MPDDQIESAPGSVFFASFVASKWTFIDFKLHRLRLFDRNKQRKNVLKFYDQRLRIPNMTGWYRRCAMARNVITGTKKKISID